VRGLANSIDLIANGVHAESSLQVGLGDKWLRELSLSCSAASTASISNGRIGPRQGGTQPVRFYERLPHKMSIDDRAANPNSRTTSSRNFAISWLFCQAL
jgi:hypothetical protein